MAVFLALPFSVLRRGVKDCMFLAMLFAGAMPVLADYSICGEKPTIYLDIGHTAKMPGAKSARGKPEYLFNDRLVREISTSLKKERKFDVKIINSSGKNISLKQRSKSVRAIETGILASIHHDSVQRKYLKNWTVQGKKRRYSDRFQGYSLFISGSAPSFKESRKLAESLGAQLKQAGMHPSLHHAEAIPGEGRPLLDASIGLYNFYRLAILKKTRIPAVLIEVGIIVDRSEELMLETPRFRKTFIEAFTRGVNSYCGLH
ncbi:N-acetylmuramoyl-L-alanine amidase AmiB [bacterium MnTg02]|nr:N-acetylmuramoyl-L-alanine amidase AmiB [bacterium MnTg02]